ncbi:PfkB family carbohydrate kinase [Streptomyces sp. NPDC091371]|uniref:PfkB family carbohydrate kinase n=1 Tax=Streptomyces sp. NPDC091371 TaxID=3155303 RepID=UPI00343984EC
MTVLVMGEALCDLVPAPDGSLTPLPGGAPANVAAGVSALGVRAVFAGTLGDDDFGDLNAARLAAAGVDLSLCARSPLPTALAVAGVSEAGTRYAFHLHDTATFRLTAVTGNLSSFSAVYVGGLAAVVPPAAAAVLATARAAAEQTVLAVDPNVREDRTLDREESLHRLRDLCTLAHLIKASDEDAELLWPSQTPDAACRRLAQDGRLVVLTRGARGSTAFLRDTPPVSVPAAPVTVIDTIGAGDAFMAALLTHLPRSPADLSADEARALLEQGSLAAAAVCGHAGADLREAPALGARAAAQRPVRPGSQQSNAPSKCP